MLKRYKIILGVIVLTVGGILFILGIWLSGTYKSRQELFVSHAERALFNVIQEFYHYSKDLEERDSTEMVRLRSRERRMMGMIKEMYPIVDEGQVRKKWEEINMERMRANDSIRKNRMERRSHQEPNPILPTILLRQIDFDNTALETLSGMLKGELAAEDLPTNFEMELKEIAAADSLSLTPEESTEWISLRPFLVDPHKDVYLVTTFEKPWKYILWKMNWQLILSMLLTVALLGVFVYLMRTIARLNQLNMLRRAFVNNMTHELKTPISTVMAALEAIQRFDASEENKEKSETYIGLAQKELRHLANMVERVLQIDVEESRKMALIKTDFDLINLIRECIDTMKATANKKVRIRMESEESTLEIHADEAHMRNVINNLLENAIKYSFKEVEIVVRVKPIGDQVQIEVSDNGQGISSVHQRDVFDMFFRVPEGNRHNVKGFGLGLAYVRQIVYAHGGHVQLQSQVNKGSVFTVSIPK